jgi:hypothetical protein
MTQLSPQPGSQAAGRRPCVDPVRLAAENDFEIRHRLRMLELSDEQIAAAEAAVELVRRGRYPTVLREAA